MGDTLTLVGIKYSDDEKVEPKITRMPEIFKNLNRNYRRKQIPDLENSSNLTVIEN